MVSVVCGLAHGVTPQAREGGNGPCSGNWELPEAAPVGKKKIRTALGDSRGILKQYVEHHADEAVVVAGYHPTATDPKYHLTIRCNAVPGEHRYTFHLYLNSTGGYSDQKQTHR